MVFASFKSHGKDGLVSHLCLVVTVVVKCPSHLLTFWAGARTLFKITKRQLTASTGHCGTQIP